MANAIYNSYKAAMLSGGINLATDTIKVALCTSSYSPNIDTNVYFSDVTNEVTGAGYTAGGATLTSPVITQDNTNNRGVFSAANVDWTSSTITARYAVIYKSTGTPTTSPLIAYIDFSTDQSSTVGDFQINWNVSNGILNIS